MSIKVKDILDEIRRKTKQYETGGSWLTKAEFLHVMDFLKIRFPSSGNMRDEAYNMFKDRGWKMSGTLMTRANCFILLTMVNEELQISEEKESLFKKRSDNCDDSNITTTETSQEEIKEEENVVTLPLLREEQQEEPITQEVMDRHFSAQSMTVEEVQENIAEQMDERKKEREQKVQLIDQYLKSVIRNLDLIESISYEKGNFITITTTKKQPWRT